MMPLDSILNTAAVAFLKSERFETVVGRSAQKAVSMYSVLTEAAIEEFRRFVALKTYMKDDEATILSPTLLMDAIWHETILDTKFYEELQDALDCRLHHRPEAAEEAESISRLHRLTRTRNLYSTIFKHKPIEDEINMVVVPPVLTTKRIPGVMKDWKYSIHIKTFEDKTFPLPVEVIMTGHHLKGLIQQMEDIPPKQQRLVYNGAQIFDHHTLGDHNIKRGSVVYLLKEQSGC